MGKIEDNVKMVNTLASMSKDTNRKVGCIFVDPETEDWRAFGYNRVPSGLDDAIEGRHESPDKNHYLEHAERVAMDMAAREGISLKGSKVYVNYFPCTPCARGLIETGVKHLVTVVPNFDHHKWGEDFRIAKDMLEEAGIRVEMVDFNSHDIAILKAFDKAYVDMVRKNWNKFFVFFDIHSTIIKPNYELGNIPTEFYKYAKEVLQGLTNRKEICMILYTCSHPHEVEQYLKFFKENGIEFDYVNENPEVKTQEGDYGCYDKKPYMNVLLEDKSGFDAERDWVFLKNYFKGKK